MITKKLYFPNFYLFFLLLLIIIVSCTKKVSVYKDKKTDTAYKIYIGHAEKYFQNSKYNSAFFYYNKSKLICNPKQDSAKIVYSLLKMATIQQIQGDYTSSETSATEAISFFNKKQISGAIQIILHHKIIRIAIFYPPMISFYGLVSR